MVEEIQEESTHLDQGYSLAEPEATEAPSAVESGISWKGKVSPTRKPRFSESLRPTASRLGPYSAADCRFPHMVEAGTG